MIAFGGLRLTLGPSPLIVAVVASLASSPPTLDAPLSTRSPVEPSLGNPPSGNEALSFTAGTLLLTPAATGGHRSALEVGSKTSASCSPSNSPSPALPAGIGTGVAQTPTPPLPPEENAASIFPSKASTRCAGKADTGRRHQSQSHFSDGDGVVVVTKGHGEASTDSRGW